MTPTRRIATLEAFARFAHARFAIVLLASLLVSAGLLRTLPHGAARDGTTRASVDQAAARSLGDGSSGHDARGTAIAPSLASVARLQVSTGRSPDGARNPKLVGAPSTLAWIVPLRTPGVAVEARARGVAAPGQPAPSSRAPPLG